MNPHLKMLEIQHAEDQVGVQNAYDGIYEQRAIRHLDSFYQWILQLLQPEAGRRLLDVACGQGAIPLMATGRGVVSHGFDLSFSAVKVGTGAGADLIVANGEQLPYPNGSFDYITNIGSLEHYVDPAAGACEMARVLAPGGRACVLLPNSFSIANMVYAWHNGRTSDDGQPIQRFAAQYEWQDLLQTNGLIVERTVKYERVLPKSFQDMLWYLRNPKNIGWLFLTPFIPLNLANSFVYMCRRAATLA